jgi:diguanylate cyclase (GGDEF)-like protein/PAS domain S-box-containing protein
MRHVLAALLATGASALALWGLSRGGVLGAPGDAALPALVVAVLLPCAAASLALWWSGRGAPGAELEQIRERLAQATVSRDYLHHVLNSMADAVFVTDRDGLVRMSNGAASRLTGLQERELAGRAIGSLIATPSGEALQPLVRSARLNGETVIRMGNGQTVPVSFSGSDIMAEDPQLAGSVYVLRDISDRKRSERRIRYLARYDALTKIPNRMQFQHLLQQAIARSLRNGHAVGLLYLDMDRFKEINDTFGHAAGDRVLEVLTERVSRVLPSDATFGRLAGDEFAVLVDGLPRADAGGVLRQASLSILQSVGTEPVDIAGQEIFLTVSIGAATCPDDARNVIDLIRNADAAMYRAKENGGNACVAYEPYMNAAANERLVLKGKLKRAVERDELVIHYLPKIDLGTGRIVGAEALLRWCPPGHGDIPPSLFIPLAEENNLINDVGEWVLNRVCTEYRTLSGNVGDPGRISLNLSLRQLRQASFILRCRSVFERHGVDPQNLELEITETTLMADPQRIVGMLRELRGLGLHLSIDDFGTGYSSLSALRQFPIGTLKIDQSFVRAAAETPDGMAIVRTIVEMGRALGMDVVAEGVETPVQLAVLRGLGCHYAQGLLFGEPCSADALGAMLADQVQRGPSFGYLFGA